MDLALYKCCIIIIIIVYMTNLNWSLIWKTNPLATNMWSQVQLQCNEPEYVIRQDRLSHIRDVSRQVVLYNLGNLNNYLRWLYRMWVWWSPGGLYSRYVRWLISQTAMLLNVWCWTDDKSIDRRDLSDNTSDRNVNHWKSCGCQDDVWCVHSLLDIESYREQGRRREWR